VFSKAVMTMATLNPNETCELPHDMPHVLTPAEALKMQGERVVVQLSVEGFGVVAPAGHVELFSEPGRCARRCAIRHVN
jgi:hypothetical protein